MSAVRIRTVARACCMLASLLWLVSFLATFPPSALAAGEQRPFAAFDPRVEIDIEDGEIDLTATFTLDAGSNGVDPSTETISLQTTGGAATYAVSIPAGSFKADKNGRFTYHGTIDKVQLIGSLRSLGKNTFEFALETSDASLKGITSPVTIHLVIGDDGGRQTVKAKIE